VKITGVNMMIILKWIFEKRNCEGFHWIDLAQDRHR
jgi:hypothetical protein